MQDRSDRELWVDPMGCFQDDSLMEVSDRLFFDPLISDLPLNRNGVEYSGIPRSSKRTSQASSKAIKGGGLLDAGDLALVLSYFGYAY